MSKKRVHSSLIVCIMAILVLMIAVPTRVPAADNRKTQAVKSSNMTLTVGQKGTIRATSKSSRSYVSSNRSVVTVSKAGVVTAKKAGTAYVTIKATATSKYKSASTKIRVVVKENTASVILKSYAGKTIKTIKVGKSRSVTLPSIPNPKGYTFVGWARSPRLLVSDLSPRSTYNAGYTLTNIRSNVTLYAVLSKRGAESNIDIGSLAKLDTNKYSKVIFVGDSRTRQLEAFLTKAGYDLSNVLFVRQSGASIDWLQSKGYPTLLSKLNGIGATPDRPVAVVFNMGVNDLHHLSLYISYMKKIAPSLQSRNAKLFYMSINPYNRAEMNTTAAQQIRPDTGLFTFNRAISTMLSGTYQYIDTCSYLLRTGYSTDTFINVVETGNDDGIHYIGKTYKRLFQQAMNFVNLH